MSGIIPERVGEPIEINDPRLGRIEKTLLVDNPQLEHQLLRVKFLDLGFERLEDTTVRGSLVDKRVISIEAEGRIRYIACGYSWKERDETKWVTIDNPSQADSATNLRIGTFRQPNILQAHFDKEGACHHVDINPLKVNPIRTSEEEDAILFRLFEWPLDEAQRDVLLSQLSEDARSVYEDTLVGLRVRMERISITGFDEDGFHLLSTLTPREDRVGEKIEWGEMFTIFERTFCIAKLGHDSNSYLEIIQEVAIPAKKIKILTPLQIRPDLLKSHMMVETPTDFGWRLIDAPTMQFLGRIEQQ